MTEPMDPAQIEAELREMLREWVRYPERPIALADHLIYDLEIEDDDAESMIPDIQRHFGIEPPASAWWAVATVGDAVALIERYQRHPPTPTERAREAEAQRAITRRLWMFANRYLAFMGVAAGIELSGGEGVALFMLALAIYFITRLPLMWRDGRRFRRECAAWKARRAAEGVIE